ncbi:TonB-dependent receptor [Altererythrobacter arenosus]|uniref:TonB-dependent receptor n=1 Tax=Altererythrobacter arenosus TaxID=3032592 RepID=A0ABY8FTT7_9SPHN|nr:TonB-dependent receptor [Altererythrobacter sp. CAU 1644]WFL78433.1 TonB-dependent receptor [Altererythrobacter sp. CAU 1644]
MNFRNAARRSAALLLASCALAPMTAHAQDEAEEALAGGEDDSAIGALNTIVVTGTKTQNAENVQDVPVAVTAFNAKSLEALKVRDIQSLSYSAPNVSLDQIGTSRGQANFSIRGLGINSSIPSIDPTVGVFVDGVYLGLNAGVVFDLFDLDSVEILRGPQGVLFGRNVTGGAVLINTGNPTDYLTGKLRASVDGPFLDGGRGGANYTVSGVVSGPLVEDTLLFKLGGYYNKDEGYFTNLFDGSNHGEAETKILRGALEGRFGDLTLTGKLDYFDSEGDGPAGQNRGQFDRESFDLAIDNPGNYDNEIWTASLTAEADIGPGTLTNIFGWRKYDATTDGDIDSLPVFIFHSPTDTAQEQFSNELRYAVSTDAFDLTVGGFWFDQSIAYTEQRNIVSVAPLAFYGGGEQDHEVLGLFAAGEWHLTDALSLIVGIRWSREEKDAAVTYVRPRPECSVIDGTCPVTGTNPFSANPALAAIFPGGIENNGFSDKNDWTNWSPKLGLQYEFGRGQLYTHWTRGYRSGGYNFRITSPAAFEAIAAANGAFFFDEEKVDNYEIGGKFQTDSGDFTLNVAAYYTDISNIQREVNQASASAGVAQSIFNTADASILGFEAEARMRVSPSLLFTANLGVMDDKYDAILFDISGDGAIDDADLALRLPRVPEVTWGMGVIHEWDLGASEIVSRVNFQYRDEFAYTDNNFGYVQDASMLDANITWNTPVDGLSLSLYGKNLLDQVQAGGDTQLPFGAGAFSNGVNRPFDPNPAVGTFSPLMKGRQVGIEAAFEF